MTRRLWLATSAPLLLCAAMFSSYACSQQTEIVASNFSGPAGSSTPTTSSAAPSPFRLVKAEEFDKLAMTFHRHAGWRGADAACSTPLSSSSSLWLFGDTFVRTHNGSQLRTSFINNTAALIDLKSLDSRFFWRDSDEPNAIFAPVATGEWYWPGDLAIIHKHLYIVAKRIISKKGEAAAFSFDWIGDDLLRVDKPEISPSQWQIKSTKLPDGESKVLMGTACFVQEPYFYVYTAVHSAVRKLCPHPIGVSRISTKALEKGSRSFEYLCWGDKKQQTWKLQPLDPVVLFEDGAAEITVTKMKEEPYLVATYMPPLSNEVKLRFASSPSGPWSEPLSVYKCPESEVEVLGKKAFVYSAKDHPEFATKKDELVVTYCSNPGDLKQYNKRPDLYYPRALKVTLAPIAQPK